MWLILHACRESLLASKFPSSDKPAGVISVCLSVEGPETSSCRRHVGFCHFHFPNVLLGGCISLSDYFISSDEESEETNFDDILDTACADENTASAAVRHAS